MHDNRSHPLLAQIPLTLSPFVSLPTATTLPYTYRTLPSTLPPSSTGDALGEEKRKYVIASSGYTAHPDDIIATCNALKVYIQTVQEDADRNLKEWEEIVQARELAEKRRVAPGWLDSDARILEPEKKVEQKPGTDGAQQNLMDLDVSSVEASRMEDGLAKTGEGEQLDRAFGSLNI